MSEIGRKQQNRLPRGLTLSTLKGHLELWPLFFMMGTGIVLISGFSIRNLIKMHDVSWRKKPEPFDDLRQKQYKLVNISGLDYSKQGLEIPNYREGIEDSEKK